MQDQHQMRFEKIIKTIRNMPIKTMIEGHNKAIIYTNSLCSLRISELRTVKLKNLINEEEKYFINIKPQDIYTTLGSYGELSIYDQRAIISKIKIQDL